MLTDFSAKFDAVSGLKNIAISFFRSYENWPIVGCDDRFLDAPDYKGQTPMIPVNKTLKAETE
jgi:hypothetical protein